MINAALVGMGYWGQMLVASLHRKSDKIRLVRAVEIAPDPVRDFCDSHGIPLTGRFEDALADPEVDAVILCTPHSLHEEQIAAAAKAGKHVFCEKPLALTKSSAEASVAACAEAGVVLGVGHERRYEKPMEDIKALIDGGSLGTLMHIESNFSHDKFTAKSADDWRFAVSEGPSAGMTGMGIHLTDAYISMFGPIAEVHANTADRVLGIPTGDIISVQFVFESGATGYLCAISVTPYYGRFTVFGSHGWAEVGDDAHPELGGATHLTVCGKDGHRTQTDFEPFDVVRANFEAFADAVEDRAPYRFSDAEKIHNIAVLEAIFESAATRKPVKIS